MKLSTVPAVVYFSKPLILRQKNPGSFNQGIWEKGTVVPISIKGCLQPATMEDLQILPEGSRREGLWRLYTKNRVRIAGETQDTESDLIEDNGKVYKALKAADRTFLGGYYKIILELVPDET